MYVAVPAFVLLLAWLLPLHASVVAVLLGFAVAPVLPPWAKNGGAVGGKDDYVIGLELLSAEPVEETPKVGRIRSGLSSVSAFCSSSELILFMMFLHSLSRLLAWDVLGPMPSGFLSP